MKDLEILAGLEWCQTILSESEARFEALLSAGPNKEDGKVIESFREYMGNSFDFFTDLRENPGQVISLYLKMEKLERNKIENNLYIESNNNTIKHILSSLKALIKRDDLTEEQKTIKNKTSIPIIKKIKFLFFIRF